MQFSRSAKILIINNENSAHHEMSVSLITRILYSGIKQKSAEAAFGGTSSNENNPTASSSRTGKSNAASNFSSAPRPSTSSDDVKLPKWFKPFGK